jgi:hypothetical protein
VLASRAASQRYGASSWPPGPLFIFAEADTPDDVEKALTSASQQLHAVIG